MQVKHICLYLCVNMEDIRRFNSNSNMSYRSQAQILSNVCASTNSLQRKLKLTRRSVWWVGNTEHTHTQKHTDLWAGTILTSRKYALACYCVCVCVCLRSES